MEKAKEEKKNKQAVAFRGNGETDTIQGIRRVR